MKKAQLIVWLALPLVLTAADTQRIDLTECAKAQDSKRERWLFGALPGDGGAKVMNESGFFPVKIREAGDYRIWIKYHTTSNKWMNMAVRIDAPGGEPLTYERIDYRHGLASAHPQAERACERPAQAVWHSFAMSFEYPGTYVFHVGKMAGSVWQQGGNPPEPNRGGVGEQRRGVRPAQVVRHG